MPHGCTTASLGVSMLRAAVIAGFALTLVGTGFVFIYASLREGSNEAAVRSEPWEGAVAASVVGAIAVVVAIYGIAIGSRTAVRLGAGVQALTVLVVLALAALSNLEVRGSDFERTFITLALLVFFFDAAVFLASWALPGAHRTAQRR